jgi:hypothetical protein
MISNILGDYRHIHFYNQDQDGLVLFANKVTVDFFGGEKMSDFVGLLLTELSSQKSHADEWIMNSRAIIKDQTPRMFIESATRKDGSVQWFRSLRCMAIAEMY